MHLIPRATFRHLAFLICLATLLTATIATAASDENTGRPATGPAGETPKNIIVMIVDGAGYNLLDATRYWTGEPLVCDGDAWGRRSMATYSLRRTRQTLPNVPADVQDPAIVYDPERSYDPTPVEGTLGGDEVTPLYPRAFAGYEWHRSTYPDSANTASAMMTGVSSYNGSINVDGRSRPVTTVAEVAKAQGKRVGVVTTVPISHATPAAAGAVHIESRAKYHDIVRELVSAGVVDVLAGTGNPDFDDDARRRAAPDYAFIAEADWSALKEGTRADDKGRQWTLVSSFDEIRRLASDRTPEKLLIVPTVHRTLQQKRSGRDRTGDGHANELDALHTAPGDDPLTSDVPTLTDLTNVALNALEEGESGFFLVIEGGAVDWACHDNQLGRAIEEYLDFDAAIARVCAYLDSGTNGNSWDNTLVVVASDHDQMLFGPDGDTVPFQPLVDNGPGRLPGHQWLFNSHSNQLVPLFFRGAGSACIERIETETDAFDDGTHRFGRGPYFHQAELGKVLKELARE